MNWSLLLVAAIEEELALSVQIRRLIAFTTMSTHPEMDLDDNNDLLFQAMIAAVDNGKISFSLWHDRMNLIVNHPSAEGDVELFHRVKALLNESMACFDQSMEDFVLLLNLHFGKIQYHSVIGETAYLSETKLASELLRTTCCLLEWYMAKKSGHALLTSKINYSAVKTRKPEWVDGIGSTLLRIRQRLASRSFSADDLSFYIQQIRLLLNRMDLGFSESSGRQSDNSKTKPSFFN